jgi:copper chaperone CopZ
MMCPHCEKRVKETLEAIAGVKSAAVNFKTGEAMVDAAASVSAEELAEAVVKAGYECNIDA